MNQGGGVLERQQVEGLLAAAREAQQCAELCCRGALDFYLDAASVGRLRANVDRQQYGFDLASRSILAGLCVSVEFSALRGVHLWRVAPVSGHTLCFAEFGLRADETCCGGASTSGDSMSRLLWVLPLLLLVATVLLAGHAYIAQSLVLASAPPAALERALLGVMAGLALLLVLQPFAERLLPRRVARLISWPAGVWMGIFFLLVPALLSTDLFFWLVGATWAGSSLDLATVARARAGVVLALVFGASWVGMRNALAEPRTKRVEVCLARWPAAEDGFRIVQLSDLHIGPILDRRFARRLVERVRALEPDLVVITGDLVDGSVARVGDEVKPFGELRARHGVYFVTGNHDHYSGASAWTRRLDSLGLHVLRNECLRIELGGGPIQLAGVDDHHASRLPAEHGEDLDAALAGADAALPLLLLAHDPSIFERSSQLGVDLQLSGHTHGGQIWPFHHLVRRVIPFLAGLYRRGEAQLYVSRGAGFWGPPMRLRAPAEIGEIVIRSLCSAERERKRD